MPKSSSISNSNKSSIYQNVSVNSNIAKMNIRSSQKSDIEMKKNEIKDDSIIFYNNQIIF